MGYQADFIALVAPEAVKLGKAYDLFPSVMIAQAIHESGWGISTLASPPYHNLFGIKGYYKGQSGLFDTWEDDGQGNVYYIKAHFRKYPSYYESMRDNADLLKNGLSWDKHYYKGSWRSVANTYQKACDYLQGRYATDTRYSAKLQSFIKTYNLTKYDNTGANVVPNNNNGVVEMDGTFTVNDSILVRDKASTSGKHVATYNKGETVKFDRIHFTNNYVWLEYKRSVGGKGYLPVGNLSSLWGTFK